MKGIVKHVWRSLHFALDGIIETYYTEKMFRFYLLLSLLVLFLGSVVQMPWTRMALLIICCAGILGLELMNTGLERAIDALGQHNSLTKFAKDAAAGSVAVFAISAIIVMIIIFLDFFNS